MNLGFPTRFLKKLEMYQQIKSGHGLARHKKLFKAEAEFLKWSYGKHHQHLRSFICWEDFKKVINCKLIEIGENDSHEKVLGNLWYKGLVEIRDVEDPTKLLTNDHQNLNYPLSKMENNKDYIRPTLLGLDLGEVCSEIYGKKGEVPFINSYKYELVLSWTWGLIIFGIVNLLGLWDNLIRVVAKYYDELLTRNLYSESNLLKLSLGLVAIFLIVPMLQYLFDWILKQVQDDKKEE